MIKKASEATKPTMMNHNEISDVVLPIPKNDATFPNTVIVSVEWHML